MHLLTGCPQWATPRTLFDPTFAENILSSALSSHPCSFSGPLVRWWDCPVKSRQSSCSHPMAVQFGFPSNNLIISLCFTLQVILHHVFLTWLTSCTGRAPQLQSLSCQAHSSYRIFACRIWTLPSARSHCAVVFPGPCKSDHRYPALSSPFQSLLQEPCHSL